MESSEKNDITQTPIAYLCVGRRADGTKCETTSFTAATAKIWPEANGFVSHYTVPLFAESRWIPVSERLPEPWGNVLIAVRGEYVFLGCVTSGGGWRGDGYMILDGVSHWMPLPAPPTDDK